MPAPFKRFGSFVMLCALSLTFIAISSPASARAQEDGPAQTIFDFRSSFWVNLHHFLYQEALKQKRAQEGGQGARAGGGANVAAVPQVEGLTPEQQRVWQGALDYYRKEVIGRDLLFDEGLVSVNRRLSKAGQAPSLKFAEIDAGFASTLESAAPVYRLKWWAEHDRANRKWIAEVFPLVVKHGAALAKQLGAAYRTEWPKARVPVEVTVYANWSGAYTVVEPTLITLSSVSPANQGNAALEIVFHEASHGLVRPVSRALAEKFEAQKKPVPRDLWHAVLFYTTGEIVRRRFAETGLKDYQPYADAHGLYTRGAWKNYHPVIAREWQPYLDGKVDFESAVTRLVSAL